MLATDLLIGVGIGIGVKLLFHLGNGVPLGSLFKPYLDVEVTGEGTCLVRARQSAVFSNWIPFRRRLVDLAGVHRQEVVLDLSGTRFVDHSTMEKLHELESEIESDGGHLRVIGLEGHRPLSEHEHAARKALAAPYARVEIVGPTSVVRSVEESLRDRPVNAVLRTGRDDEPTGRIEFICAYGRVAELEAEFAAAIREFEGSVMLVTDVRRVFAAGDSASA